MKIDRGTKAALWVIAALLFLNLLNNIFISKPALAVNDSKETGRYQISSWAAQSGRAICYSGYYVLDTVTGKVKDRSTEAHIPDK